MKETYGIYHRMLEVFVEHTHENGYYDVDMFCRDLCKNMFQVTDPQDIGEYDYFTFQQALVLLVRDDMLLDWFGLLGLCVIHAEMMDYGKRYYVNREIFDIKD